MNTSSRFAFAVHVLALLSLQEGTPLSSEMIAGSVNTNPALIRRLLTMLAEAGLTTSQLGAGGGALLAQRAEQISLLDVYRAVDDAQLFALHREEPNPACMVGRNIRGRAARNHRRSAAGDGGVARAAHAGRRDGGLAARGASARTQAAAAWMTRVLGAETALADDC